MLLIAVLLLPSGCCGVRAVPRGEIGCAPGLGCGWPRWVWPSDCRQESCQAATCQPKRWHSALAPEWCEDYVTQYLARCRARRQLRHTGEHSRDFKSGFLQAFEDIADGAAGVVPAVPPKKYWSAYYRTPEGQQAAHDWFDGYRAGVAAVGCDGRPGTHRIAAANDISTQVGSSGAGGSFWDGSMVPFDQHPVVPESQRTTPVWPTPMPAPSTPQGTPAPMVPTPNTAGHVVRPGHRQTSYSSTQTGVSHVGTERGVPSAGNQLMGSPVVRPPAFRMPLSDQTTGPYQNYRESFGN